MARPKRAAAAANAIKKGSHLQRPHKVWQSVTFRRPTTLTQKRTGMYKRHSVAKAGQNNIYSVIEYPIAGEAANKLMEEQNTLVFIVNLKSTKTQIKRAFKERYNVNISKVNTVVRPDGKKKAFITLQGEQEAVELGSKVGLI